MATTAEVTLTGDVSGGRVFERAFATIRHNPGAILGLALLFGAVPTLLLTYVTALLSPALDDPDALNSTDLLVNVYGVLLLTLFGSLVISALTQAAMTRATVMEAEGRVAGLGESLAAGFRVLLPLIVLSIVYGIAVFLGLILLIVPGIILWLMWSVSVSALVEERRGIFASLARSAQLTKGSRWKIFGIFLVILVISWLIAGAVGLFNLSAYDNADVASQMPIGFVVVSMVTNTLISALFGTVQASLYVELRDAKDGPGTRNLEEIFA